MRDCSDLLDFLELSPKCIGSTAKSCLGKHLFQKENLAENVGQRSRDKFRKNTVFLSSVKVGTAF